MHYHGHVYYQDLSRAQQAHQLLGETHPDLFLFPVRETAIGPHPVPSFGMAFGEHLLPEIRHWMQANTGWIKGLIHPVLGDDLLAHTQHAVWIGGQLELRMEYISAPPTELAELSLQKTENQPPQLDIERFDILHGSEVVGHCTMGAHYRNGRAVWRCCELLSHEVVPAWLQRSSELIHHYLKQFTDCRKIIAHRTVQWNGDFDCAEDGEFQVCVLR